MYKIYPFILLQIPYPRMLISVKCKNVKMYFSQNFPKIFLHLSRKSCIFAEIIYFVGCDTSRLLPQLARCVEFLL